MDRDQVLFRLFGKFCTEGTILFTEGSPGDELFMIQNGAVRVGAGLPQGRPARLLGPGELLGEEAFFEKAQRPSRAEVVRDTRLILVSDRTIDAVIRHGPQTGRRIAEQLLALASATRGDLALWTFRRILRRVAPYLAGETGPLDPVDLAERSGQVDADVRFVIEELERQGCVVRDGESYRLPDPGVLQKVLDEVDAAGEAP